MRNLFRGEPEVKSAYDFSGSFTDMWRDMRVSMVIPPLTVAICICVTMSIMMFIERVYMTVVLLLVKFTGKKKYTQYKLEALKEDILIRSTSSRLDRCVLLHGHRTVSLFRFSMTPPMMSFKAYRYQQHRWSCGPANLLRKMTKEIIFCERVSVWKKFHVIYAFFLVRKIIAHWVTFFFYCVIIPISIMVPEVHLPKPIAIYIPATITLLNSSCTLRSMHLLVLWILFENVMSFHRSKATIIGLLGANRVNEWVVTEKLGNATKQKSNVRPPKRSRPRLFERLLFSELLMGLFLLYVACYDIIFGKDHMFIYLLLQSTAFFVVGVGYVGITVPN